MWAELLSFVTSHLLYLMLHLEKCSTFPKPLTAAQEQQCFARMEKGDPKAREELIEHNLRLVAHIAKKYAGGQTDSDDLLSIGTIGLIKAVSSFSFHKGTRFATYAAKCIENEILMYFRSLKKTAGDVYISDPIESDKDGNPLTLLDIVADETNIADLVDLKIESEKLRKLVCEYLEPRERIIIQLRYGLTGDAPLTQREIARKLRISRSYVSRLEKRALEVLRQGLE